MEQQLTTCFTEAGVTVRPTMSLPADVVLPFPAAPAIAMRLVAAESVLGPDGSAHERALHNSVAATLSTLQTFRASILVTIGPADAAAKALSMVLRRSVPAIGHGDAVPASLLTTCSQQVAHVR